MFVYHFNIVRLRAAVANRRDQYYCSMFDSVLTLPFPLVKRQINSPPRASPTPDKRAASVSSYALLILYLQHALFSNILLYPHHPRILSQALNQTFIQALNQTLNQGIHPSIANEDTSSSSHNRVQHPHNSSLPISIPPINYARWSRTSVSFSTCLLSLGS